MMLIAVIAQAQTVVDGNVYPYVQLKDSSGEAVVLENVWTCSPQTGNALEHGYNYQQSGVGMVVEDGVVYVPKFRVDADEENGTAKNDAVQEIYMYDADTGASIGTMTLKLNYAAQKYKGRRFEYFIRDTAGNILLVSPYSNYNQQAVNNYYMKYLNKPEQMYVVMLVVNLDKSNKVATSTRGISLSVNGLTTTSNFMAVQDIRVEGDVSKNEFSVYGITYQRSYNQNEKDLTTVEWHRSGSTTTGPYTNRYVGTAAYNGRQANVRAVDNGIYIVNAADKKEGLSHPVLMKGLDDTYRLTDHLALQGDETAARTGSTVETHKLFGRNFAAFAAKADDTGIRFRLSVLPDDKGPEQVLWDFPANSLTNKTLVGGKNSLTNETVSSICFVPDASQPDLVSDLYVYGQGEGLARYRILTGSATGVKNITAETATKLQMHGHIIEATGASDKAIEVFSADGRKMLSGTGRVSLEGLHTGVYIAKCGDATLKTTVR